MAESTPPEQPESLPCFNCRYELTSLPRDADCPECGYPILSTLRKRGEVTEPLRRLPRLKLTLIFLLAATLSGAPVLIGYAGLEYLQERAANPLLDQLRGTFLTSLPYLMILGSLTPLLTILSVPSEIGGGRYRKRIAGLLLILGGGGATLVSLTKSGNALEFASIVGYPAGTIACAIGLATAARYIGRAVPQWKQLGSARQTAAPLISAILLIAILRPVQALLSPMSMGLAGSEVIIIGSEILLVIGSLYLMVNRLWLSLRLIQAMTAVR
ncbi:MAG: hypothetical protein MK082_03195 [Phycisphaerales bacterium]|nr:hypothetical protein [Phycisphaerales bacterium]